MKSGTRVFAALLITAVGATTVWGQVSYPSQQNTGLARALCPRGAPLIGGGGFIEAVPFDTFKAVPLRQTYPISDRSGVIAFGSRGIGWQVASSNFQDLAVAFSVCAMPPLASAISVQYVPAFGVGLARAFCPAGSIVTGGGAFAEVLPPPFAFREKALRQSYPISDATGVIAWGNTAVGWQAASSNFTDLVGAFAVCTTPTVAPLLTAEYISAQATGVARAFCPAGTTVLGGGGFVESPSGGLKEEKLRQTHPISDATGVIASGTTAIGWQAASSDFTDTVVAFAICGSR